jgi:RHS repeat-associated protein
MGALVGGPDEGIATGSRDQTQILHRRVVERRTYQNNTTMVDKMVIGRVSSDPYSVNSGPTVITVDTYGATTLKNRAKYFYHGNPLPNPYRDEIYSYWKDGFNYETQFFGQDGTTLLSRQLSAQENSPLSWLTPQDTEPANDPRLTKQVSITIENGQALAVLNKIEYDNTGSSDPDHFSHLNVKRRKAYNYKVLDLNTAQNGSIEAIASSFSESELISVAETDYLYDDGHKARHILGLPFETRVMNPASPTQILAKSQIIFDEQNQYYSLADFGSTINYEAPTGNYAYIRGNATTFRTWFAEENRWLETHTQYDNFGNVRRAWDSSGVPSRFVEAEYSSQYYFAYQTKTTTPAPDSSGTRGTSESSTLSTDYDFWTGSPTVITNDAGQVTSIEYDARMRAKKVIPPVGEATVEKIYNDTPDNLYIKVRRQIDAQNWAETTTFFDNLGRAYKTQTKDIQGDIFRESRYDGLGRVEMTSNPYRQGEQVYWSKQRYDNANRVVETYAPAPEAQTGASLGIVQFGISTVPGLVGNYIEAADASGRKARSINNVLGQIVRFDEPTGNNNLGSLESPTQPTNYTYNVKNELIKIEQGQQKRYFRYDSLGRLVRVKQPEQDANPNLTTTGNPENNQWTMGYTYDTFGNLLTITDAKNTIIENSYDKNGRIKTTTYSDGTTPQVDYYYDGTGLGMSQLPQTAKGNLTKVTNGISETRYTNFDNLGRALSSQQITDNQTYSFGYKYDNYGNLGEITYPSQRVVKTHLDANGGLSGVSSKRANGTYKNFASNFSYTAAGDVKAMMLGNGLWETSEYNSRLQIKQTGLGTSATDTSLWKVNYEYGELNEDGSVNEDKNVGNIAKQVIAIPTTSFVQTFKYDALNRLKEAKETASSVTGAENWKQTFDYDRYGNRTSFYQKVGTTVLPIDNKSLPQVDPNKNRFTTGQGYIYDYNGNLVQDAENRGFTYDGNDKQTVVRDLTIPTTPQTPDANVIGKYYYDGEGKRVKKVTNSEITIFVYDATGDLAAEYATAPPQNPTTSYLTADNLGSPRIITDKQGNVTSRRDFMPFGEELTAGVGNRTTSLKYSISGLDNIRQRFTGYEKDDETGLDYAEARMYQNRHGRFTGPDPLLASVSLSNPQTFNRYVYTGNNPLTMVDPSGLSWCRANNGSNDVKFVGMGQKCDSGWDNIDNTYGLAGDGDWTKYGANTGDAIKFNPNGTVTVIATADQIAASQALTISASDSPSETISTTTDAIITTFNSAMATFAEDNGFEPLPVAHNNLGRLIGHGLALLQTAVEIGVGGSLIAGGAAGEVVSTLADATGVGLIVGIPGNVLSGAAIATGVAIGGHGTFVGVNTIVNIYSQATSGSGGGGTPSGGSGSGSKPPNNTPQGPSSNLKDSTTGNSVRNTDTNASPLSVAKSLKKNGFKPTRSTDRKALIFTKGSTKYVLRTNSKSTGGPTLHHQVGKDVKQKIRLK